MKSDSPARAAANLVFVWVASFLLLVFVADCWAAEDTNLQCSAGAENRIRIA